MSTRIKAKEQYALAKKIGLPVTYTEILHNNGVIPPLTIYPMPKCMECGFLVQGEATCSDCETPRTIETVDMIWDLQGKLIQSRGEKERMFLSCDCGCPHIDGIAWDSVCLPCQNEG